MPSRQTLPYGTWPSPVSAAVVVTEQVGLGWVRAAFGRIWWIERRPHENGRTVLCRADEQGVVDWTPSQHHVRTLVHEYGGLAYAVAGDRAWYVNLDDQRVYRWDTTGPPTPITPDSGGDIRYADLDVDRSGTALTAVRERHEGDTVHNDVVLLAADGSREPTLLVDGEDFYAAPRRSPDGSRLAWLQWSHPRMPWDSAELWSAHVDDDRLRAPRRVAGGRDTAALAPAWSDDGALHWVDDRTGWWNLYRERGEDAVRLVDDDVDIGSPAWLLGSQPYAFLDNGAIACVVARGGLEVLEVWSPESRLLETAGLAATSFAPRIDSDGDTVAFIASSGRQPLGVYRWRVGEDVTALVRGNASDAMDPDLISVPEHLAFVGADGSTIYALFYPPTSATTQAPPRDRPPLLVDVHGGPTSQAKVELRSSVQYWTSRGYAVVEPNYSGSSGYGRAYRERLRHRWGYADVDDVVTVVRSLIDDGRVDGRRVLIRGHSAGGYTVLRTLAATEMFAAGTSHSGVTDPHLLAAATHKFEASYLDYLLGDPQTWSERAPVDQVGCFHSPILILQGLEDPIVPPSQAEHLIREFARHGISYAYAPFPEEGHELRQPANAARALRIEHAFYSQVLGLRPAEDLEDVHIVRFEPERIPRG